MTPLQDKGPPLDGGVGSNVSENSTSHELSLTVYYFAQYFVMHSLYLYKTDPTVRL
jgi:hypothetical protein